MRWKTWILEKLIKSLLSSLSHSSAQAKWWIWMDMIDEWSYGVNLNQLAGIWQDKPPQRDVGIACDPAKNHESRSLEGGGSSHSIPQRCDDFVWLHDLKGQCLAAMEFHGTPDDLLEWSISFLGMWAPFGLFVSTGASPRGRQRTHLHWAAFAKACY